MTTITVDAEKFARVVLSVEKARASDTSRPVLGGIFLVCEVGTLEAAAADGFRLSVASADCDAQGTQFAILRPDGLIDVARHAKKLAEVRIAPDAGAWTFECFDGEGVSRLTAVVDTIDGTFPNYRNGTLPADDSAPTVFGLDPKFVREAMASAPKSGLALWSCEGPKKATLIRIVDRLGDKGAVIARHVIMPMVTL